MKKIILTMLAVAAMGACFAQSGKNWSSGSTAAANQAKSGDAVGASVTAKKTTMNSSSINTTTTPGLRNAVNNAIDKAKADQNKTSSSSTSTSTSATAPKKPTTQSK